MINGIRRAGVVFLLLGALAGAWAGDEKAADLDDPFYNRFMGRPTAHSFFFNYDVPTTHVLSSLEKKFFKDLLLAGCYWDAEHPGNRSPIQGHEPFYEMLKFNDPRIGKIEADGFTDGVFIQDIYGFLNDHETSKGENQRELIKVIGQQGTREQVIKALDATPQPDADGVAYYDSTPLTMAIERNREVVPLLIERGADLNFTPKLPGPRYSPAESAIRMADLETLKLLLENSRFSFKRDPMEKLRKCAADAHRDEWKDRGKYRAIISYLEGFTPPVSGK